MKNIVELKILKLMVTECFSNSILYKNQTKNIDANEQYETEENKYIIRKVENIPKHKKLYVIFFFNRV